MLGDPSATSKLASSGVLARHHVSENVTSTVSRHAAAVTVRVSPYVSPLGVTQFEEQVLYPCHVLRMLSVLQRSRGSTASGNLDDC